MSQEVVNAVWVRREGEDKIAMFGRNRFIYRLGDGKRAPILELMGLPLTNNRSGLSVLFFFVHVISPRRQPGPMQVPENLAERPLGC